MHWGITLVMVILFVTVDLHRTAVMNCLMDLFRFLVLIGFILIFS